MSSPVLHPTLAHAVVKLPHVPAFEAHDARNYAANAKLDRQLRSVYRSQQQLAYESANVAVLPLIEA